MAGDDGLDGGHLDLLVARVGRAGEHLEVRDRPSGSSDDDTELADTCITWLPGSAPTASCSTVQSGSDAATCLQRREGVADRLEGDEVALVAGPPHELPELAAVGADVEEPLDLQVLGELAHEARVRGTRTRSMTLCRRVPTRCFRAIGGP